MEDGLSAGAEEAKGEVGVEVAEEEEELEEDHGGVPDGGGAAQEGDDHLGDHGLDEEEEAGAQEEGKAVEDDHGGSVWVEGIEVVGWAGRGEGERRSRRRSD